MGMSKTFKNGTAAGTTVLKDEVTEFTQQLKHGTKLKVRIAIEVKNYSSKDIREILSFISSSARNFYLSIAEKINSKP